MTTTPTTPTEAVTAALAAHPEASAAELAEAAGIGGSTVSKCLASLERDGIAVRAATKAVGASPIAGRSPRALARPSPVPRMFARRPTSRAPLVSTRASCPRSCSTT